MKRENELPRCPFCGAEAKLETGEASEGLRGAVYTFYDIICSNEECVAHPPCPVTYRDKRQAVKAWSKRI